MQSFPLQLSRPLRSFLLLPPLPLQLHALGHRHLPSHALQQPALRRRMRAADAPPRLHQTNHAEQAPRGLRRLRAHAEPVLRARHVQPDVLLLARRRGGGAVEQGGDVGVGVGGGGGGERRLARDGVVGALGWVRGGRRGEGGGRTDDFEGAGVARGAGVGDDDVVEGGVAAAEAGEADFEDHGCGGAGEGWGRPGWFGG